MDLTDRHLNRSTLHRQGLLQRQAMTVPEAVRAIVAIQAQEAASPYIALWNRIEDFAPEDLDAAFAEREVVKASLMRITLHAVHADDYPWLHTAMRHSLRASRLYSRRFKESGRSIEETEELVGPLLEFMSEPRTKAEIDSMLAEHTDGDADDVFWWAIRTFAPLHHVPGDPPWAFGRLNRYVTSGATARDRAESVRHLVRRYLEGFGPATIQDIGQFAMLPQSILRPAVKEMEEELDLHTGPRGERLLDVPGGQIRDDLSAPPRLLPMWDSVLFAYKDRRRVIPEEYRRVIIRQNGDTLPSLLVDGRVAGVWRAGERGIEAILFEGESRRVWSELESEASDLARVLRGREPSVYSRYDRWWSKVGGTWRLLAAWT